MSHPTTSPIRMSSGWDDLDEYDDRHDVGIDDDYDDYDDVPDPAGSRSRFRSLAGAAGPALAGALVALVVTLQQPAPEFMYDAGHYWNGALAVLEGGGVFERGLLSLRGIATSFMYLPAAAAFEFHGGSGASFAVLAENAVLIALVGRPAAATAGGDLAPRSRRSRSGCPPSSPRWCWPGSHRSR